MTKIMLIDDSRLARLELKAQLAELGEQDIVAEAAGVADALEKIERLQPELIFLDINMPDGSGFDLLAQLDYVPSVIFVTAYDEFALQSFEVNALDYLLKPVTDERIKAALEKYQQKAAKPLSLCSKFFIKDANKCFFIALDDVLAFEAMGNYTQIHLSSNKVSVYRTMSHIESRLPSDDFFRAGRSWIINVNQIKTVELEVGGSLEVTLNNQLKVPLSRKQTALFKQKWRL
ncbi:DNA-binding response regulator [Pseudoalteromonas sp. A25]|uniref:LytR/AlgR family response regulator transcription factor n=1 Tax=Pseudoalteromonas sp. A25 TaxID=116092 RepID=UPI00126126D5|nr:LytTR family DNA-binding domain-containing protein [Pseudoalteromonas sp. A25]BBN83178.1 DNA-binding response regulator [Pseudoalteromonas sp. A25]